MSLWTADGVDIRADETCWTADGFNGCGVDTHDPGFPKRWPETQVVRESHYKKLKKGKIEKAQVRAQQKLTGSTAVQTARQRQDDEETLVSLVQDEDEQTLQLVELASHLLRTLH